MTEQLSRQSRKEKNQLKEFYSASKLEIKSFRDVLRDNIIITSASFFFLILLLPYLARYVFINLWTYSHDNIVVHVNTEDIMIFGEPENLVEALIQAVVTVIISYFLLEFRWVVTYVARIVRFTYLSILSTMITFLVIYFVLSIIIQNKVKFRVVIISTIISLFSSFGLTYILIPNNNELFDLLVEIGISLIESPEILNDLPTMILDIIYTFYWGFVILILMNLILSTAIEYALNKW